jgi:hypothetical protein
VHEQIDILSVFNTISKKLCPYQMNTDENFKLSPNKIKGGEGGHLIPPVVI